MRTALLLAVGATLFSQVSLAGSFVNARSLYQGNPPNRVDISDTKYDFATPATSETSVSLVADGGQRTANAWALVDPITGAFKGRTYAASGSSSGDRTSSWASGGLWDVFRVQSSNAYEQLQFTISYDSLLNTTPITTDLPWTSSPYPIRHTDSNFQLSLSHQVANPYYVEGGEAGPYDTEYLANQTGHIWTFASFTNPATNGGSNVKYTYQDAFYGEGKASVIDGVGMPGHWTGTFTLTIDVPTNKDLSFSSSFELQSFCYMASVCESINDSTHSFHLGVQALGGVLISENGYLGLPTAPVPEPETWAMLLAGLGMMGVARRRRLG